MSWFKRKAPPTEERAGAISISDPGMFALFGQTPSLTGVPVTEITALGVAAVWRAVSLISGGIAMLPLSAVSTQGGVTQKVPSWLDNPGFGYTKFELVETVLLHLLLHGNAFLAHVRSNAGELLSVYPIHPMSVEVEIDPQTWVKTYRVMLMGGGYQVFTDATMTHIKGQSLDGIRGLSPIALARNGVFGTSIAADRSAARLFEGGALMSGIVTDPDNAMTPEQAQKLQESLTRGVGGEANAGKIAVVNRNLQFSKWSLSNEDAQWLQSRSFQVEEVSRWYGIPSSMIALNEKQSSWGTGIAEMHQAMATYTFGPWTGRIEDRLSPLLPQSQKAQFDYHSLLSPDPEAATGLLIEQLDAGLITLNEARAALNRPPLPNGDVPKPAATPGPAVHNEKG